MSKVTYTVIRHDGGWAYRVDETISEPFATHDLARQAAELASKEQMQRGETVTIEYEDKAGHWHREQSESGDRPTAKVKG